MAIHSATIASLTLRLYEPGRRSEEASACHVDALLLSVYAGHTLHEGLRIKIMRCAPRFPCL